jgi:hypothetical protein
MPAKRAGTGLAAVPDVVVPASMSESVEQAVAAIGPVPSDAGFVAVARQAAASIDAMPPSVRDVMYPQLAGILLRALDGLEKRAAERRKAEASRRGMTPEALRNNPVYQMRQNYLKRGLGGLK